jgi:Na+/melibiose symporter-like transporter
MDYGEWKTGQRNEAMIGSLAGVAGKISNYLFNGINTWLRFKIGFRTGVDYTNQPLPVQRFVWGMFTFFPAVTGNILSMIPKFFYNLSKEDRERMYEDLKIRRATLSREITDAVQEVHH